MDLDVSYMTQIKEVRKDPNDVKIEVVKEKQFTYNFLDLIAQFGGFVCILGNIIALFMAVWNYRAI